jgi:hypothetical protein
MVAARGRYQNPLSSIANIIFDVGNDFGACGAGMREGPVYGKPAT